VGLNAALAAHFDAVTLLATGDDSLAREAEAAVPGISTIAVKWAWGTRAAENLHPDEACALIEAAAATALEQRAQLTPVKINGAVELEVDVLRPHMTQRACAIPDVELRAPLTLGFTAPDLPSAYDMVDVFAVLAAAQ
jgi:D-amino peptidase